ncbi:MAG: hypothetical protein WCE61_06130 [Candidatus Acidiferrum sp.]
MSKSRKYITNVARTFIGCHYLWGSGGGFPGHPSPALNLHGPVTWARPSMQTADLALYAAQCDSQGHYVCAGRCKKAHGHVVGNSDVNLEHFLKSFANLQEALWACWYMRLTPRRVLGDGVPIANSIAFAENCLDVRHFDCISFINYVLNQTTSTPDPKYGWTGSIQLWVEQSSWSTEVKLEGASVAGDILIRWWDDKTGKRHYSHIAFLDDDDHVVQAQEAIMGVHADDTYVPSSWQMRRRLPEKYLRPDYSNYA